VRSTDDHKATAARNLVRRAIADPSHGSETRMFKTMLRGAVLLLALLAAPALADQGTLCSPTTGTVSGLTLTQNYNAALQALVTSNSGASSPANACSGAAQTGQLWLDQSATPSVLRIYDGANWLALGAVDAASHIWTPPVGGGAASIASATTTDLGSVPQGYLTVTGTTAITGFGSSATLGTSKIIRFAGSLTLTYNATSLILPTAANISTAAGDTALAVSLGGGNWVVVAYQRADGTITGQVGTANIANGAVTSSQIAANTITGSNIASSTIPASSLASTTGSGSTVVLSASPALSGSPTTPTQTTGDNTTKIASDAFVNSSIAANVYTGTSASNATYPIGTTIYVTGSYVARNTQVTIYTSAAQEFSLSVGTTTLTGTWSARGCSSFGGNGACLFQRIN